MDLDQIIYEKTTIDDQMQRYFDYTSQTRLVDTFWEEQIFDADIYAITKNGYVYGCFSILSVDGKNMLTSFFIKDNFIDISQQLFADIVEKFQICGAYAVTNDELFFSLCMDIANDIKQQAYFFDDVKAPKRAAEFPADMLKPATNEDTFDLEKLNFFHSGIDDKFDKKFVMRNQQGVLMGAGHIVQMKLIDTVRTCGMVVSPEFLQMGVGRSIIIHLKEIIKRSGNIPIAGCWYCNYNSKQTLMSCGFASKTRYIKFKF